jgi:hypothetical protein
MPCTTADKRRSAVLSLVCLAVAVAIYLGMDTLTAGAWSEYLKLRANKRYESPGRIEFQCTDSPGTYPQPNAPGYGGGGGYGGGSGYVAEKRPDEWTLLWLALIYFTIAALFAATACYFFYRAFGPFFIEEEDDQPSAFQ